MAEEGPGARRLSPHNKDPSLVTSYLPPNLQKAPCHPSKAPALAACAAARRDEGGRGGWPPPLPPGLTPPGLPAPRMRSSSESLGLRVAAPRAGWDAGNPRCPLRTPTSSLYPPPKVYPPAAPQRHTEPSPKSRALLGGVHNLPVSRGRFTSACAARPRHRAGRGGHSASPPGLPLAAGPEGVPLTSEQGAGTEI